ncbi:MAG: hypothetical protein ACKVPX_11395, partial [Myxococcaceae bacterium]
VSGAILRILSEVHASLVTRGESQGGALRLAYEAIFHRLMAAAEILPNHFLEPRDVGLALLAVERQLGGSYLDIVRRELLRREILTDEDLAATGPSLAGPFRDEKGEGKLNRRNVQSFVQKYAKELGVERPLSLKVDTVHKTLTGGQIIRFQLTEHPGQKHSPFRNRGAMVTDSSGNLIFQYQPLPPDVTSKAVSALLNQIRDSMRKYGTTSVLIDEGLIISLVDGEL